jgi:hypothetical protein
MKSQLGIPLAGTRGAVVDLEIVREINGWRSDCRQGWFG